MKIFQSLSTKKKKAQLEIQLFQKEVNTVLQVSLAKKNKNNKTKAENQCFTAMTINRKLFKAKIKKLIKKQCILTRKEQMKLKMIKYTNRCIWKEIKKIAF